MKVVRLSTSRTGRLYPRKCSWYSFSLGAESTAGLWYGQKDYIIEKSSDTTGNRSRLTTTQPLAPDVTGIQKSEMITEFWSQNFERRYHVRNLEVA